MTDAFSRRRFLGASAGAVLLGAGADAAAATGPCTEFSTLEATLGDERDRLGELEAERDSLAADLDAFLDTIAAGRDAARGEHPYDVATRETAREVGLAARPGMVFLEMVDEVGVGTASAWFVDEHLLLTNNHNVADLTPDTSRTFWTIDGERHEFDVVGRSETGPDIALLRTDATAPEVLPTGSADAVAVGDRLIQVGNPGGFGQWVLTLGELAERQFGDLVTTVPGLQGVSGSPLLDMAGTVVGVTYAGRPKAEVSPGQAPQPAPATVVTYPLAPASYGLHVPIERALELVEEWT